jgi:HK97 family phage prohead protease
MKAIETLTFSPTAVRFALDSDEWTFSGYLSVWGVLVPSYNERVAKGAFTRSLREHRANGTKPALLWSHNPDQPIGIWTDLTQDNYGLKATGQLVRETAKGAEAYALMKVGALGLSPGFRPVSDRRAKDGVRELLDIDLIEGSLTPVPAQPLARIDSVRSLGRHPSATAFVDACREAVRSLA